MLEQTVYMRTDRPFVENLVAQYPWAMMVTGLETGRVAVSHLPVLIEPDAPQLTAHPSAWLLDHSEEDDLTLLAWSDREVAPHTDWVISQVLSSPRLRIAGASATPVAEGLCRVAVTVGNAGWLPTYVTQKARDRNLCGETSVAIEVAGGEVLAPAAVEWVVAAPSGATIDVVASHPRAGTVRTTIEVPGSGA